MAGARTTTYFKAWSFVSETDMTTYPKVPKQGMIAFIKGTNLFKIGDGKTSLANLPWGATGSALAAAAPLLVNLLGPTGGTNPGTVQAMQVPAGQTNDRPTATVGGMLRYNAQTGNMEHSSTSGTWKVITSA
jgi:hypothetical protein